MRGVKLTEKHARYRLTEINQEFKAAGLAVGVIYSDKTVKILTRAGGKVLGIWSEVTPREALLIADVIRQLGGIK